MPLFPSSDILLLPVLLLIITIITYAVYLLGETLHETTHLLAIWITGSTLTDIKITKPTGFTDPLIGIRVYFDPRDAQSQRAVASAPYVLLLPVLSIQLGLMIRFSAGFVDWLLLFALIIALVPNQADINAYKNA